MLQRRDVLRAMAAVPAAGLPLAVVLANPELARAQAATLETVTITVGGKSVMGALAKPAKAPAGTVLAIHEWWGLNDQMKAYAADMAAQGYAVLACDLMGGSVAATPDEARALLGKVPNDERTAIVGAWVDWLKKYPQGTGKVATVGFCFGGGWSLNASLARPVDATVIYYGNVAKSADDVKALAGPVLGHFATRDQNINKPMVDGFAAAMQAAGKSLEAHWYEADHGFANPTAARYDAEDTKLAQERTLAFLKKHLG
ncbi:MAG: dienelactone hydrolase family protein [Alphaproteobacteria bacterium]